MSKFRKKQKRIKHITHSVSIVTALYMLFFIGAETYIRNTFGSSVIFNYIAQVLIVVSLILLLVYYSTYGKCERYLEKKENEIADAGYYLTARTETTSEQYFRAVCDDLSVKIVYVSASNGYGGSERCDGVS